MFALFIRWLRGYLTIQISGRARERFLNICSKNQIELWNMSNKEDYTLASLSRKDYKKAESFIKKTDVKVEPVKKIGLPYFFYRYRKRKCFAIGLLLFIALIYSFTLFIWDISVEGEAVYTSEQIIKDIKENYVPLGTMKKDIDCAELEKQLRQKYDKIAWISCEIKGTQLNIVFTETIEPDMVKESDSPCNIIAAKDCIITDVVTRSGRSVVKAGDEVKKGDILITGAVNIYNDFDELIETDYVPSSGDVYGITEYNYYDSFSMNYYIKEYSGEKKTYFSFGFGSILYTPYTPKVSYDSYDTLINDKKMKFGETFYLPLFLKKTVVSEYHAVYSTYTEQEAYDKAVMKLNVYLSDLNKKGVEILENNVTIEYIDGECIASGTIVTKEPVGIPADITIIEQGEEVADELIL